MHHHLHASPRGLSRFEWTHVTCMCALQAPADVEETDELLLWDEEMADVDPEQLPRRLLTDFSIYNAEVGGPFG